MKKNSLAVSVLVCALSLVTFGQTTTQKASTQPSKRSFLMIKKMPDVCQIDSRLPNRGKEYCGPAAVSNAIVWFALNGHRDLMPSVKNIALAQFYVIEALGSENYMKTALYAGTDPIDVLQGLDRYIRNCGYDPVIEWKGYREGGDFTLGPIPEPKWMADGFDKEYNLVLEIGWYNYCSNCRAYQRNGGHYVTVSAIDLSGKHPKLIVHNPSFGGGKNPKPEICTLTPLTHGTLAAWGNYSDRPAKGYCTIKGLTMPSNANIAILEGVIKFTVHSPKKELANRSSEKPVMGMTGF